MRHALATAAVAILLLAACGEGEEEGATMLPGSNCMASGCHSGGGDAPRFTAAGTVFAGGRSTAAVAGATVTIVPNGGATVTLTTNAAGNFFTGATLTPPLAVSVSFGGSTNDMAGGASSGACGACHEPAAGAAARVHVGTCGDCH